METVSNSGERVGLRSIAKASGYHSSTVSLALKGDPSIPAGTAEAIVRCADAMGYRKDLSLNMIMAKVRMSGGSGAKTRIAYLLKDVSALQVDNNYARHYHGAKAEADRLGYDLFPYPIQQKGISIGKSLRELKSQGVQVLLIPGWDSAILDEIGNRKFIVVLIGYSHKDFHYVGCDYFEAMNLALDKVLKSRYRSLGLTLWHDPDWSRTNAHFLASLLLFESSHPGIRIVPRLLVKNHQEDSFARWYCECKPDLVISDYTPVYEWLKKINPTAGFIQLFQNGLYPDIAGIDQRLDVVGQKAVSLASNLLIQRHAGISNFTQRISIVGEWKHGKTF